MKWIYREGIEKPAFREQLLSQMKLITAIVSPERKELQVVTKSL